MTTKKHYALSSRTYIPAASSKTNIVLYGSFSRTKHSYTSSQAAETCLMEKWESMAAKSGGHYVIGRDGTIYACVDPSNWTEHVGPGKRFQQINRRSISVFLTNELFLEKENNNYYAFGFKGLHNSLYRGKVFERAFKGYTYWADYDEPQITALGELLKELSEAYAIPLTMLTKTAGFVQNADRKSGIVSGSNLNESSYSLPLPTWVTDKLKAEGIQIVG